MSKSNNPPEVIVELTFADAEMLAADCRAAQGQILALLNVAGPDDRREYLEKLINLLEHKKRVMEAVLLGSAK